MRQKTFRQFIVISIILICFVYGATATKKVKGGKGMQWHDKTFAESLSIIFEKPTYQITEDDFLSIESVFIANGEGTGLTIYKNENIFKDGWLASDKKIKEVDDLVYFKNLTVLTTNINADYSALKKVSSLKTLEFLGEDGDNISSECIQSIAMINSLEELILPLSNADYAPLNKLPNLKSIKIKGGTGSYIHLNTLPATGAGLDLSALQYQYDHQDQNELWQVIKTHLNITMLEELSAGDEELLLLSNLKNLTTLHVGGNFKNLSALSTLVKLKRLTISTNNNNLSLKPLVNLTQLEYLYVHAERLSSLEGMEKMSKLEYFNGSSSLVEDISALSHCKNLRTAYLYDNLITDISALSNNKKLTCLYLIDNEITDISPLRSLPELNEIYISHNPIPIDNALYQTLRSLPKLEWYEGPGYLWVQDNLPNVTIGDKTERVEIDAAIKRNTQE